jgi:predicted TPR repeat methyltransferase
MVWRFERNVLKSVVETHFLSPPSLLDFACGTGRIISFLSDYCQRAVGVDVSESMLSVARSHANGYSVVCADITRDDALGEEQFDLVTAFRFFPNAEADLRREALVAIRRRMATGGILVFNNHKNSFSALYTVASVARGRRQGMRASEVKEMIERGGFQILETRHIGIIPATDRFRPCPIGIIERLESFAARFGILRNISSNVIYVCRAA